MMISNHFSQLLRFSFRRPPPEENAVLIGYSALIETYQLNVPLPDDLCAISHKHKRYKYDEWEMYTPRYAVDGSLASQLTFALKHEGIHLWVLNALFQVIDGQQIVKIVQMIPTGTYSRRIWFLYEWLTEKKLDIPDALSGNFVELIDDKLQYAGQKSHSSRHRVYNNLPGVKNFCPMVRKTKELEAFINQNLAEQSNKALGAIHPDILMRAAAFLLLKDSKASYAIEGEKPPQNRVERWANAIGQAGKQALSLEEFLNLQSIVIGDFRFTHHGFRNEGGFIGEHERSTHIPIPEHISARWQDVYDLMCGLIEVDKKFKSSHIHPVIQAAMIAFGFVFIHPFADGNGRIHRYLIHHVLAEQHFIEGNMIFPVSAVILAHITQYKAALEAYSKPRLPFIRWRPTSQGNVEVLNETIDLYRYFDCTKQAVFLFECIKETVEVTLPNEIDYLEKYDRMRQYINEYIEMPDNMVNLLIKFLEQEKGKLSKRALSKEFKALSEDEVTQLETTYAEIFYPNSNQ